MKEESKFQLMGHTSFLWTVPITSGNGGKFNSSNEGMTNFGVKLTIGFLGLRILPRSESNDFD